MRILYKLLNALILFSTTRNLYCSICGEDWQDNYKSLHRSILEGKSTGRYLLSIPIEAGLSDILVGYISGFIWALLTNRAFLIYQLDDFTEDNSCARRPIEVAYDHSQINWTAPFHIDRSLYSPCLIPWYYRDGRNCDNNKRLRINGNEYRIAQIQKVNTGLETEFTRNDMTKFPLDAYNHELFMFASNRGVTYRLFDNPNHAKTLEGFGLRRETAFPCLFTFLFNIKHDQVCSGNCSMSADRITSAQNEGVIVIGIHIRHGEGSAHFNCAENLATTYATDGKKVQFLLVTSFYQVQVKMFEKYGNDLFLPMLVPQAPLDVHYNRDRKLPAATPEECEDHHKKQKQAIIESARDIYLLSLADVHVVSHNSGFGALGAMTRPREHGPTIYVIKNDDTRDCKDRYPLGDPLSDIATQWSGI